jgi:beta-lactamase superfamily II metal-dependent hydrolase
MAIHILGIRHHGPGSASNVKAFLETVKPDIVLVEGPPEADAMLQWVSN